jgi:integrase
MLSLVTAYRQSGDFTKLAATTCKDYLRYLRLIEEEFGDMPVAAIADRRARGKFKAWRDTFAATPRTADCAWSLLARVLSCAADRGLIAVNVCQRGGRLYEPDRAEIIWTAADIAAFCMAAPFELQLALMLALWTGQRQSDLIRLTWTQYDGTRIRLRQGKGRRRAGVDDQARSPPAHSVVQELERQHPQRQPCLVYLVVAA